MMAETYCSGIVGLTKITVYTTCACCVDDTAILLLNHVGISCAGDFVCAAEMDRQNLVPQAVIHIGECLVAQNSSVVDHDIDPAVCIDGGLDNCITVFDRRLVADGLATHFLNFLHDRVWIHEIVDNNRCATFGKGKAVASTKTRSISLSS